MIKKLCFILGLLCSVSWIHANTYNVTTTSGNNVTGSFAEAISLANAAPGPHTITFTGIAVGSTITSPNAALYLLSNSGITIDATGRNIIFVGSFTASIPYGITLSNGANNTTIKGLTFRNFTTAGIQVTTVSGTKISGCYFGTAPDGSSSVNTSMNYGIYSNYIASNVTIGGSTMAERNYFADCSIDAIYFNGSSNVVISGNYFGIDASGNTLFADVNNASVYLFNCSNSIIGGSTAGQRNLFAGSTNYEVQLAGSSGTNNKIYNNYFGYNAGKTAQLTYNNGIVLTNSINNLIAYNFFATTYANPFDASGAFIGNKLTHNSYDNHSGDPNSGLMSTNVTQPQIYSVSSTILKGIAAPGDSIEIYYANSYDKSGLTFIAAVKANTVTGRWSYTGSFTVSSYVAVTATNNSNNTTSWFSITGSSIYACANTPTMYPGSICKNNNLSTVGISPSGSVGTTNPTNAGLWSTTGTGTFSNGALYGTTTKYFPSAADLAAGSVTFTLVTTDTNCVNNPAGVTGSTVFLPLPVVNVGSDQYSCSSNTFVVNATPTYYGNSNFYSSWSSLDVPGNVTFSNYAVDNPTITFSAAGSYRIVRSVGSLPFYCNNTDTLVITYKPTPTTVGTTLTTPSQVPVTYTVPAVTGEILTAYYYAGSVTPTSSIVTSSANTLTYKSTGTFYGSSSFTFYVQNQCGGTSSLGTINVNVTDAPPVVLSVPPVTSTRGGTNTVVLYIPNYVTDVNNDINPTSFNITNVASGASFAYNTPSTGYVTLTYSSPKAADFVGLDSVSFKIADYGSNLAYGKILIEREKNLTAPSGSPDDINVYNAVSPDGDGINDFLHIVNLADYVNTVTIYDRWGDKVWEGKNYNNTTVRFEGFRNVSSSAELPNGTYFYVIKNESRSANGEKAGLTSGYLVLVRQQ